MKMVIGLTKVAYKIPKPQKQELQSFFGMIQYFVYFNPKLCHQRDALQNLLKQVPSLNGLYLIQLKDSITGDDTYSL